jgi:hypothetical protein
LTDKPAQTVPFDDISVAIKVTTPKGVTVPVKVTIQYPEGYGLWAVQALARIPEHANDLYHGLATRGDASVMNALLEQTENQDLEVDPEGAEGMKTETFPMVAPDAKPDPSTMPEPAEAPKKAPRKRAPRKTTTTKDKNVSRETDKK